MKIPNLFLLGGPKCGTTSFHEYLADHPQIFMSQPKEPCYFDKDIPVSFSPKSDEEYLRCVAGATSQHAFVGESSTGYLYSRVAVPNILKFNPDAKFMVMVRNPIEMAASLHSYFVQEFVENVLDFRVAWGLQEERRQGLKLPFPDYQPDFLLYGDFCRLGEQLRLLYHHVPRDRVHVMVFDDLVRDPAAVYRQALDFLGLPDDGRKDFSARNVTGFPKSPVVHSLFMGMMKIRKAIPVKRMGLGFIRDAARKTIRPGRREVMPEDFRLELVAYFREDVALLSEIMDRDFGYWLEP